MRGLMILADGFADTEAFKKVQSQMPYWDKYEKDSHNFDEDHYYYFDENLEAKMK